MLERFSCGECRHAFDLMTFWFNCSVLIDMHVFLDLFDSYFKIRQRMICDVIFKVEPLQPTNTSRC